MKTVLKLDPALNRPLRRADGRMMSYNIEMTEVTGGTFWRAYTPGQIAGTEAFQAPGALRDFTSAAELTQYYPPIDLKSGKLRRLAKALGPAWLRVSGTWATKTYYDFDGAAGGRPPEGYASVLAREQWLGVLDFVRDVGCKLLVSISNCAGDHPGGGPLDLAQAEKLFALSREYGVDIDAAEFMNEPNMLELSGAPAGYTAADYARDQDIFGRWLKENYPACLFVGPCSLGDAPAGGMGAGIGALVEVCSTQELLRGTKVPLDVFSYHYYNGISERLASMLPEGHWDGGAALTDAYLAVAPESARAYARLRDRYVPGGQMWVTESGDAGGGGDTWASTYLDVPRTLNELGSFGEITDGVIFHNTLASSDYGFLEHGTFEPRPNYFAVLLWNRLMGETVYDCGLTAREGAHVYCRSRRDGKEGFAYLVINNSPAEPAALDLPTPAEIYALAPDGSLRSPTALLNGALLALEDGQLPEMPGKTVEAGVTDIPPGACVFVVV